MNPGRCRAASLGLALFALVSHGALGASLCRKNEETLLSCAVGQRQLAVCAVERASDTPSLVYRYGTPASIELEYPKPGSAARFVQASEGEGSAKAQSQALGFGVGRYRYGVFATRSAFGYNGAGVTVGRDGRRLQLLQCQERDMQSDRFFQLERFRIPLGEVDFVGPE